VRETQELDFTLCVGARRAAIDDASTPETVYRVALEFPSLGIETVCWDSNAVLGIELCATRAAAMLLRRGRHTTSSDLLEAMLAAWEHGTDCETSAKLTVN